MDNKKLGQLNNLQNSSPTGGSLGNLSNFEMLLLNRMRQLSPTGGLLDGPNELMKQMQSYYSLVVLLFTNLKIS